MVKVKGETYEIEVGQHAIERTARLDGELFCRTAIEAALQFLADNYPAQLFKQKGSRVEEKRVDDMGRPYIVVRDYVSSLVLVLVVNADDKIFHVITVGKMKEFYPRAGEYVITINQDKTITYLTWVNVLQMQLTDKPVIERKVKGSPVEK